jgi:predicted transport protein
MIFNRDTDRLSFVREIEFKLEKDIQKLVEKNLDELFKLSFLTTEFSIEGYRFDTVAFNREINSFVIIEYKRGRNESLVDQGYAYLYTLLNRKADFVLLFNETTNSSRTMKDFDWTQTRIFFISPQFTDYQKSATEFSNMPFILYEIKQYSNGIVSVSEITHNKAAKFDNTPIEKVIDDSIQKVVKEIVVYTEQDLLDKGSESTIELYTALKQRILELGDIKVDPKKLYIAFKGKANICDIVVLKKELKVFINLKKGKLKDPEGLAKLVDETGHWGNGDYQVMISDVESFDYLMTLIRQSFKENM